MNPSTTQQFLSRTLSSVSSRLMRTNDDPTSSSSSLASLPKRSWIAKRSNSVSSKKPPQAQASSSSASPSNASSSYITSVTELAPLCKQLKNVRESKLAEQLFDEERDWLSRVEFDNKSMTLDELHLAAVVLLERSAPRAVFSDKAGLQLLFELVQSVRQVYRPNPYHDFRHCVDVMQFSFFLLGQEDVKQMLLQQPLGGGVLLHAEETVFVLLVACLCHDAGHDGLTNALHRQLEGDALVKEFGQESPLERLHAKHCRELVGKSKALTDRLLNDVSAVLELCEHLILATDMENHRALLAAFHVEPVKELLVVVIKMADISNVTRDFDEAKCWAKRLEAETKDHVVKGTAPAPPLHKSVTGFAALFAVPLAEVLRDVGLAETGTLLRDRILANNRAWDKEAQDEADAADEEEEDQ